MKKLILIGLFFLAACVPYDPDDRRLYDATREAIVDTCAEGAASEVLEEDWNYSLTRDCSTGCLVSRMSSGNGWGGKNVSTAIECPDG